MLLTKPLFLGRTDMIGKPVIRWSFRRLEALPGGTISPLLLLGPSWRGPYSHPTTQRKASHRKIKRGASPCFVYLLCFYLFIYLFIILFEVLRPFQGYFSSYETGQSVGVTKMGEHRRIRKQNGLSRMWPVRGSNLH